MRKESGFMAKIMLMYAMFTASTTMRKFNRVKDNNNNYSKNSSGNWLRGKHTPKHPKKDLQRSHFGTFSPIKKIKFGS